MLHFGRVKSRKTYSAGKGISTLERRQRDLSIEKTWRFSKDEPPVPERRPSQIEPNEGLSD